jgi:hypothetical protein
MTTIANQTITETNAAGGILSQLIANSKIKANKAEAGEKLPATVEDLLQEGKALTDAYEGWKITFEAPSDKATWKLIDQVGEFIQKIELLSQEDQTKMKDAMRADINGRSTNPTVNKNTEIEPLVVKFIFKGMIRQTAYNYSKALELARKAGKKSGGPIAQFIDASGGIMQLIQANSLAQKKSGTSTPASAKEKGEVMVEFMGLNKKGGSLIQFNGDVLLAFDQAKAEKAIKAGNQTAKNTKGSLVFFAGVPAEVDGQYHLVQCTIFDQETERKLIGQMTPEMNADGIKAVKEYLETLKTSQGFEGMAQHLQDEALL